MSALLSVVMPTQNRSSRLERAARSVLDQDAVDIELVIVDDASSDETPDVTTRLAEDRRVTVVRNDEAVGPGAARNRGIAVASGDLLGFCDDDDAWLPGAAHTLVDYLSAHAELGTVTSWHQVVNDVTGRSVAYCGPLVFDADDLLWFNVVALPFAIIRRDYFSSDLAFDERVLPGEDWDLWLRCAQSRPIAAIPQVLYEYHQHAGIRVTKEAADERDYRQTFVDKHWSEMTPACRVYHRATLAHQTSGRGAMLRELSTSARSDPLAATYATGVLAATDRAASLGIRRGDPGLAARTLQRLLAHQPSSIAHRGVNHG